MYRRIAAVLAATLLTCSAAVALAGPGGPPHVGLETDVPVGIPDDNPSHEPENGDGICDRGETVVKTTPSGRLVTVPCQTAGHGHGPP